MVLRVNGLKICPMNPRILITLLFAVLFGGGLLHAQNDSLLCTFYRMESGEVWVGREISRTDTEVRIQENILGEVAVQLSMLKEETNLYKGTELKLTTSDQGKYTGIITGMDEDFYLLSIAGNDEVAVPKSMVTAIEVVSSAATNLHNPNATRYLFAPSAIPLKKGTGYYQNAYILLNSANYGLTDNISIGGGVGIPLFFFVNPKIGTKVAKNLYVAGGAIAATTFIGENITVAIPFAAATYGTEENNATLAAGYGLFWFDGDFSHSQYPITTLNGMMRLSNRLHLVTENWVIPIERTYTTFNPLSGTYETSKSLQTYLAAALGLRIKVGEQASLDVAPVFLSIENDPIVLPYIDFVYKF